jgi:hypothetical protein
LYKLAFFFFQRLLPSVTATERLKRQRKLGFFGWRTRRGQKDKGRTHRPGIFYETFSLCVRFSPQPIQEFSVR